MSGSLHVRPTASSGHWKCIMSYVVSDSQKSFVEHRTSIPAILIASHKMYEQIVRIPVFSKNDECFYRWIVCVFTFIHVFFFDFESAKLCYKGTKRYENTYLFLIFFFLIGLLGEPFFFLVAPSFLYFRSVLSLCRRFLFSSSTLSDCCRKSNWLGLWLSNSLESTRLNNTEKHSANTTK